MNIAVLLDNPFTNDRRVSREVECLAAAGYKLTLFCVKAAGLNEVEVSGQFMVKRIFHQDIFDIKKEGSLKQYYPAILETKPAVIHCHDQNMLHIGREIKKLLPAVFLVYDSHELFHAWPLNLSRFSAPWLFFKSWVVRKYLVYREKRNSSSIDLLITVNQSIAEILTAYFQLERPAVVLRNIPEKQVVISDKSYFRQLFTIPAASRILVFIGSAVYRKTLNLEQVIAETATLPDVVLLIIAGEQGGKEALRQWVKAHGYSHVFFHPKITPGEIGDALAACDAGLVPTWNKRDLSYWLALDNKLFEYIMAEIPVLATRQPEYMAIVEKFGVGICVDPDEPGAYARGVQSILAITGKYAPALRRAKETLNWEKEQAVLLDAYARIPRP